MPVTCPHCSREFPSNKLNARHLAKCNPASSVEVAPCLCGHESTSLTQMKRHRKECSTWLSREVQAVAAGRRVATNLERFGVVTAAHAPEVVARRKATVQARYGVGNLFQSEEIKARSRATMQERYGAEHAIQAPEVNERRKATNLERYGVENAFASEAVQAKIRETMVERHGVENPQQVPEIRARTKATTEARHGGEFMAAPGIRAQAVKTNLKRYGTAFPGGNPEVQAKVVATNLARYGVPHTCIDPDVRRHQLETMEAKYGGHFFASEEGKAAVRAALKERFGVAFPGAIEGHWEKVVATFRERLGVDHPLQLIEYLERRVATSRETYGTDNPIQNPEVKGRMIATKIAKYGNPWGPCPSDGPNGLERKVMALADGLMFTGDFTWWRWLPKLGHHKNPDFIVPGPDPKKPFKGVTKVVEVFGDFWHSRIHTGRAPFEHEADLVEAFAEIGIECLVVWESEVKSEPKGVQDRLAVFLGVGRADADAGRGDILDLFG